MKAMKTMKTSASRFARRRCTRGFSHISMVIESAAVMGWFVVLVLGEKYMDDATRARRGAEDSARQSSVVSSMGFCGADALLSSLSNASGVSVTGSLDILATGTPQLSASTIAPLIAGLGLGSLKTLPNYFMPFQAANARAMVGSVRAAEPLGFTSGTFGGQRMTACLERSLDMPGAPWINLRIAREGIFITNIMGYL